MILSFLFMASMLPLSDGPGEPTHCSSVLTSPHFALTAAHCVISPVLAVRCGSVEIPASVRGLDADRDLAMLELVQPCDMKVTRFAKRNPDVGTAVEAHGCYTRKCGWRLFGHVSAYDQAGTPERIVLVSDVPIFFGNSGGPLLNKKGELVGIASMLGTTAHEDIFRLVAYFTPVEEILSFVISVLR